MAAMWQLGTGRPTLERQPTHADPLDDLVNGRIQGLASFQRILTHEKLSGRLANVIYSMETSQTEFLPYQFKPVLKLLESPTNSLLIADEVGLGKTIEAGLIWTELRARRVRAISGRLSASPARQVANRIEKPLWRPADICGARELLDHLAQLKQDPNHSFAVICLLPWPSSSGKMGEEPQTKTPRLVAHLLTELSVDSTPLDLVVMDEAHYMRNGETAPQNSASWRRRPPHTASFCQLHPFTPRTRTSTIFCASLTRTLLIANTPSAVFSKLTRLSSGSATCS